MEKEIALVEEKVYCKYVGEHSQSQRHLVEYRVDITRLSWAVWGEREKKGEGREVTEV